MNIFAPFGWFYENLVYTPLLNLLQLFYDLTGDIGWAIVFLSLAINLLLLPIFASSYINSQRLRVLQPKLRKIQQKYKKDRKTLMEKTIRLQKDYGVNNGSIFLALIIQLFFVSGVWRLTRNVSQGLVEEGLYSWIFDGRKPDFSTFAFNFIEIGDLGSNHIWLPIANSLISLAYGYYIIKLAPKPDIPKFVEPKKTDQEEGMMDPEALQKSLNSTTIFFFPALIFFFNLSFPVGLNLYALSLNVVSLIRQVFLNQYYSNHIDQLIEKIKQTDPSLKTQKEIDAKASADQQEAPKKNPKNKKLKSLAKKSKKSSKKI